MPNTNFQFGDQIRHVKRPEWGTGSVLKTENVSRNGTTSQRVSIRFANAGVKTLSTEHAELERVSANGEQAADPDGDPQTVADWLAARESGFLADIAPRKIEELMTSLPMEVRDAFTPLKQRVTATLALFRFDRSGRGMIDWAVAQSQLRDPLSHFNRQELEQFFDRWATRREAHLAKLLGEWQPDKATLQSLLEQAPPGARQATQRVLSMA